MQSGLRILRLGRRDIDGFRIRLGDSLGRFGAQARVLAQQLTDREPLFDDG